MEKIRLIIYSLFVILLICIPLLLNEYNKSKQIINRLEDNITKLTSDKINLRLTTEELKESIKNKDNKHARELDSIAKAYNIKIRDLKKYQKIEIREVYVDTLPAQILEPIKISDSTFQIPYEKSLDCLYLSGRMISTDKNTKLYIDSIKSTNVIYILESYKRTFWDIIFFRKGSKTQTKVGSKCGETKLDNINIVEE